MKSSDWILPKCSTQPVDKLNGPKTTGSHVCDVCICVPGEQEGPVSAEQQENLVGSFSSGQLDALGQLIKDIAPITAESMRHNQVLPHVLCVLCCGHWRTLQNL
jgi:hypothetical protein